MGRGIELYDGYYSLVFITDKEMEGNIISQKLTVGDKIFVFNAEKLTSEKIIHKVNGPAFKINFNCVKKADLDNRLGYAKFACFIAKFTGLNKQGGILPVIEFSVIKVVEDKVLMQCRGLRKAVNYSKFEEEAESMKRQKEKEAEKHDIKDEITFKRYNKMLVKDMHSNTEAIFTWWNIKEEVKVNDNIRAVSIIVVNDTIGLHFNTINRSFVERML